MAWTQAAVQQMAQGVAGYQDTQRLATDVEEIVRELRSLAPKVDSLGILWFCLHLPNRLFCPVLYTRWMAVC